jgi:hypothetical protein
MTLRLMVPAALVALSLALAAPAAAVEVAVTLTPAVQEKFDEELGARELPIVTGILTRSLERRLQGTPVARVEVTITGATPNRPTLEQLGDTPGLSFESYGIGLGQFEARALDASGAVLAELDHSYQEFDIAWARQSGVWRDFGVAADGLAGKIARATR